MIKEETWLASQSQRYRLWSNFCVLKWTLQQKFIRKLLSWRYGCHEKIPEIVKVNYTRYQGGHVLTIRGTEAKLAITNLTCVRLSCQQARFRRGGEGGGGLLCTWSRSNHLVSNELHHRYNIISLPFAHDISILNWINFVVNFLLWNCLN